MLLLRASSATTMSIEKSNTAKSGGSDKGEGADRRTDEGDVVALEGGREILR